MRETRTQIVHWWLSLLISESRLCAICNNTIKTIKRRPEEARKNKDSFRKKGNQWKGTHIEHNNYHTGITHQDKTARDETNILERAKPYDPVISCGPRKTTIHRIT
jgi:hypothetical protein